MSFPSPRTALLATGLLTGCLSNPPTEPEPPAPTPGPSEVRGSHVLHYRTDEGDFTQPIIDPPTTPLEAFALEADGPRPLTVLQSTDGTFRIPNAPAGKYYLRFGTLYLFTDSREVNLDRYDLGRQDARTVSTLPSAAVTLSGMRVQDQRSLPRWQIVSAHAGVNAYAYAREQVPAGAASLSRLPVDYRQDYPQQKRLLDASRGDVLYFSDYINRRTGNTYYAAVERFFTQRVQMSANPADTLHLEGALQPLAPRTLSFDWRRADYQGYRALVHPDAVTQPPELYVQPTVGSADAWYGYAGDLLSAGSTTTGPHTERFDFTYGNPYPTTWGEVVTLAQRFNLDLLLPGTTYGTLTAALHDTRRVTAVSAQGVFAPRVSPVRNMTVDGADAQRARTLGSLTPRVAWTAPEVGTPSVYRVRVSRLYVSKDGTRTEASHVAYLSTKETSVDVLPGLLLPGQTYVFTIFAYLTPEVDLSSHPYAHQVSTDVADAQTLSGILSTPTTLGPQRAGLTDAPAPTAPDALEFKAPGHAARTP